MMPFVVDASVVAQGLRFGHACSGEMRELCQRMLQAPGAAPPWKKLLNEVDDPSFLGRHRRPSAFPLHSPDVTARLLLDCGSSWALICITMERCYGCSQTHVQYHIMQAHITILAGHTVRCCRHAVCQAGITSHSGIRGP